MGVVLAVDVGGTKLAVGIVDGDGRLLEVARGSTPQGPDVGAGDLWEALEALLERFRSLAGVLGGVGCGCGGPMRWPEGSVSPLNVPGWRDFPLRERLRERFPGVPVRVHNDAICTAIGEHWRGAGRGHDNVLGMVVSTGVGGGLVLGGRVVDGASGNAGHIGHVVADPDGPPCECGGRGCVEAIARGPALAAWARDHGWRSDRPEYGLTAYELALDAVRGHPVACEALRRAGRALGVAVASATALCDLEVVAIGGGLSQAGPLLFDPLRAGFRRHAGMAFTRRVRIVPAELGQGAGLLGAGALVLAGDRYWSAD